MVRVFALVLLVTVAPATASPAGQLFAEAQAAVQASDYETALAKFETAVAAVPDNLKVAAEYRQLVIRTGKYERSLAFFARETKKHPRSAHLALSHAFALIDSLPVAGKLSQMRTANAAIDEMTRALALGESWLALYSRGDCRIYFPRLFGKTGPGLADLEKAKSLVLAQEKAGQPKREYHALTWVALGDGHWRNGDNAKARQLYREGVERYPDDARLQQRLGLEGKALDNFLEKFLTPTERVPTHLRDVYGPAGWQGACDCDPGVGL